MTLKNSIGGGGLTYRILPLFLKTNVPSVFELGTCGSDDRTCSHCATEIEPNFGDVNYS